MVPKFILVLIGLTTPCWSVPQYGGGGTKTDPIPDNQCGHTSFDCVPYFQCQDGVIVVDGTNLIDVRTRPQANCINPDYPEVPALCCLIPGKEPPPPPAEKCPLDYEECVDFSLCSADGTIITDGTGLIDIRTGYTSCWLSNGLTGRCCTPPAPYVDVCPGKSFCTNQLECFETALDASGNFVDTLDGALWSKCSYGGGDGVCCLLPKVITQQCPGKSLCTLPSECKGTALDIHDEFVPYDENLDWTYCPDYDQEGICCIEPDIKPPIADTCGVRNYKLDARIAAGEHAINEAEFGEFPWQVILFYQNYTFICGGSLISNKHVVTAGHCVNKLTASAIRVRLGEWQVNSFDEAFPYEDIDLSGIYIHPDFKRKNLHNDIALLELAKPVEFNYHINTVCLPPVGTKVEPYTTCFTSGWGKDSFEGQFQHILKKIDLPYVEHDYCQNLLRKTRLGKYFYLDKSFVCAGGELNKDACYGDGGGPLVCKDPTTSQYMLTGITAWGIGCGTKDVPGVYVNVEQFTPWIESLVSTTGPGPQQGYGK